MHFSGFSPERVLRKPQTFEFNHITPSSAATFHDERSRGQMHGQQATFDPIRRSPCSRKADDTDTSRRHLDTREGGKTEGLGFHFPVVDV